MARRRASSAARVGIRGGVSARVIDDMCECRLVVVLLVSVLMTAACAGAGSKAPVVERSTTAAASQRSGGLPPARAGTEAGENDWTATVRPLGESGSTATRALPGDLPPDPAPVPIPATSPASPSTSSAPVPMSAPMPMSAPASGGVASTAANPAVVSLLNTASAQSQAGDYTRAAATLERAIAIEPNNAWLWHYLAAARLREGRLDQAASLAAKSNSLTATDRPLQINNWKLIAAVRRHQGDAGAAAAAESRAAALLQ